MVFLRAASGVVADSELACKPAFIKHLGQSPSGASGLNSAPHCGHFLGLFISDASFAFVFTVYRSKWRSRLQYGRIFRGLIQPEPKSEGWRFCERALQ
jgi:hypothetical protein